MTEALRRRRLAAFVVAVAACSTAWVIVLAHYGPRMTADMGYYLSGAENLAAGRGLTNFWGNELSWFPPGLSLLLTGVELVGLSARSAGVHLNAVLFGATVLMSGLWLNRICRSAWVVVAAVLTIAVSRAFQANAITLHSEPLFILVTIASLICVSEYLRRSRSEHSTEHRAEGGTANRIPGRAGHATRGHAEHTPQHSTRHGTDRRALWLLLAAGVLAGLSGLTRYVGVVVIASSAAVILLWRPSLAGLRTRLRHAVLFGAVASLPVVAVLARNLVNEGRLLGERFGFRAGYTMWHSLEFLFQAHYRNYFSFAVAPAMLGTAGLVWLAAAFSRRRSEHRETREMGEQEGTAARLDWPRIDRTVPFAAFWMLYCLVLVVSTPFNDGPLNYRIYLPGIIALLFVGCEALDTALGGSLARKAADSASNKIVLAGSSAVIVMTLGVVALQNVGELRSYASQGNFGNDRVSDLADSETVDWLQHNDPFGDFHGIVWSNRPVDIYLLAGIQPVRQLLRSPDPWTDSKCLDALVSQALAGQSGEPDAARIAEGWRLQAGRGIQPTESSEPGAAAGQLDIVWFDGYMPSDGWLACDIADLASRRHEVQQLQLFADGGVYRFVPDR